MDIYITSFLGIPDTYFLLLNINTRKLKSVSERVYVDRV